MRYWGTDIDGVSLEPEQLNVRGQSLNDIVSRYSYTGAIYHLLAGRDASSDQEQALDDYLTQSLLSLDPDHPVIRVAQLTAQSGAAVSRAMTAGLMAESASESAKLT